MAPFFPGDLNLNSGIWVNPKTGSSFKIKDTIIEDNNQFSVITDTGARIPYSSLSSYIQTDESGVKDIKKNIFTSKKNEIPIEVMNELEVSESSIIKNEEKSKKKEITNSDIISKILSNNNYYIIPELKKISFSKELKNRIIGLISLMGIKKEDIITWCITNLLDDNKLKESIKNEISKTIDSIFNIEEKENG